MNRLNRAETTEQPPIIVAGCGRHRRKCHNGLGIPDDPRFWPKGATPRNRISRLIPAEGEGEG